MWGQWWAWERGRNVDTCDQAIREAWSENVDGSVIHKPDIVGVQAASLESSEV